MASNAHNNANTRPRSRNSPSIGITLNRRIRYNADDSEQGYREDELKQKSQEEQAEREQALEEAQEEREQVLEELLQGSRGGGFGRGAGSRGNDGRNDSEGDTTSSSDAYSTAEKSTLIFSTAITVTAHLPSSDIFTLSSEPLFLYTPTTEAFTYPVKQTPSLTSSLDATRGQDPIQSSTSSRGHNLVVSLTSLDGQSTSLAQVPKPTSSSTQNANSSMGLGTVTGLVLGSVIGVVAAMCILLLVIWLAVRYRRRAVVLKSDLEEATHRKKIRGWWKVVASRRHCEKQTEYRKAELDAMETGVGYNTGAPHELYVPRIGHDKPAELDALRPPVEIMGSLHDVRDV
ncbi:hypothetical protein HD806DRAFT_65913 [Xylariaceae sp. AK1471]|nr:hypothetical protein HD806DRAFT_65913 [Xylariaceae sp. AK1471]